MMMTMTIMMIMTYEDEIRWGRWQWHMIVLKLMMFLLFHVCSWCTNLFIINWSSSFFSTFSLQSPFRQSYQSHPHWCKSRVVPETFPTSEIQHDNQSETVLILSFWRISPFSETNVFPMHRWDGSVLVSWNYQLMVNCWVGLVVWDSNGALN